MPNVKRLRVLIDFAVHVISKTCILNSLLTHPSTNVAHCRLTSEKDSHCGRAIIHKSPETKKKGKKKIPRNESSTEARSCLKIPNDEACFLSLS